MTFNELLAYVFHKNVVTTTASDGRVVHARTDFVPWNDGRCFTVHPEPRDPLAPTILRFADEGKTWVRGRKRAVQL